MNIDEQIKTLMRVKEKIELYRAVIKNVQTFLKESFGNTAESLYPGLANEFENEISDFCQSRIDVLNGTRAVKPSPLRPEEMQPLDAVETKPPKTVTPDEADPVKFLMKHRHLDGKTVKFMSNGSEITGRVRGLVVPNITIETDLGYVVQVKPSEIQVI